MLSTTQMTGAAWGYGLFILQTLLALGVIASFGYLVVRLSQRRFNLGGRGGRMRVIERLPLDQRRAVHLIAVDDKTYLVGTSEQSVRLLTEIDGVVASDARDTTVGDA